ncbi:MAG: D-alanyl-D-alanine carboxypeptidase/D-alanyl-D-alanine-endopeptidase [bacterium]|nr:D-alanyl-D-alanine carboxypeptidase/D-alanyl-D-alanine-endopeptidase [bacterium]
MKLHCYKTLSGLLLGLALCTATLQSTVWAQEPQQEPAELYESADAVPARQPATELKAELNDFFKNNPALGQAQCGAYIKVLDSERVLYSHNGDTPLVPASNLKIVTTATALDLLGPDYRYTTELWGPPVSDKGVIQGNLYLRGNGDPTNTPPYWETPVTMYEQLASQLQKAGVRAIIGDIVADDSLFDREYYPQGWSDNYHLENYAPPVAGLSLNGNLVDVRVSGSGAVTYPSNNHFKIAYSSQGASNTAIERKHNSRTIVVRGPLSDVSREITVDNPPLFAASAFGNVLASKGIIIKGKVRLIRPLGEPAAVTNRHQYASISSPNLKELITEINQQSDNFLAEHLFKTIGASASGKGSAATGESCVKRFLQTRHISTGGLHMLDGCGLSKANTITPCQLADTLIAMAHHKYADIYYQSLASNEHGTLRYRIPGTDVHGKTGTLDHFTSLSGYVTTAGGQVVVFSMLFNKIEDISVGIDIQNRVVSMLAQYPDRL